MKEVVATERGIWQDVRRDRHERFQVEDDAVATWFIQVDGVAPVPQGGADPELTYAQLYTKPVSLQEALKRGTQPADPKRAKKAEARNLDVLTK